MSMFGLEPEFVTHNTMRGLSGGQKVKVVLASATWRRPHVVILDEPTNYLDRESLAALIESLKTFEGGVLRSLTTYVLVLTIPIPSADPLIFSCFTAGISLEPICSEVWAMRDGYLEASGHNWTITISGPRIDKAKDEEEEFFDALGNKIEAPKKGQE
ncbi:hypothetical protein Pst134EB_013974 [Puccinia striiformis f. sp. tritici]|nr:hypothetical protein Pst134EB_013974 [Puccinia striiformis f. sp. tritici]